MRVRRERRLRRTVHGLQGCLGALSGLERRVLMLRAGVGAGPPRTRSRVARRLDMSTRRVTRLEHRGVRNLRGLAGAGRCGAAAALGGQGGGGALTADGSPLATAIQGLQGLFEAGPRADRTEVKSERRSSDDQQPAEGRGTTDQRVMSPPRVRIGGVDLTLPLLITLGLGALVWAVRTARREHGPTLP